MMPDEFDDTPNWFKRWKENDHFHLVLEVAKLNTKVSYQSKILFAILTAILMIVVAQVLFG